MQFRAHLTVESSPIPLRDERQIAWYFQNFKNIPSIHLVPNANQ